MVSSNVRNITIAIMTCLEGFSTNLFTVRFTI